MPSLPLPQIQPVSLTSAKILPPTGSYANVVGLPLDVYLTSTEFITGAVQQVSYVYQMLGGNMLQIEIEEENVYASYQDACLEYSKIINQHQAKNVLGNFLGTSTGSFDSDGEFLSGSALSGGFNPALSFPRFVFGYSKNVSLGVATQAGIGGSRRLYSASVALVENIQEYDLQSVVADLATTSDFSSSFSASNGKRINIERVYFKSPGATWRFYGYYAGLSVLGNLHTYGQYADDTSYEVIPAWHNKLQAMTYETNLYTRASHYSYEIHNNRIRLYPPPKEVLMTKLWFLFSIDEGDPWTDVGQGGSTGIQGVNNINTLPFANIPYEKINSIGKQWIRKYSLATCKEQLAQVRGKLSNLPIPGNEITLNYDALNAQAKEEKDALREELNKLLDELTYAKISEMEAQVAENNKNVQANTIPLRIYVG